MKKIFINTALLLLSVVAANAQLLSLHKEYYIKLSNGKAMSFQPFAAPKVVEQKAAPSVLVGGIKTPNSNVNKLNTLLKTDSLVFDNFNNEERKQVWIIEFITSINGIVDNNRNFDFKGDVDDNYTYFTIRNKFSGKYLTRTGKIYKDNTTQVLLAPLSKNGTDENQQWSIATVEDRLRGTAKIFLGRSSLFGITPRLARTDFYQPYIANAEQDPTMPGVNLTALINLQKNNYGLMIEPATKAEKIILNDVSTICPKNLLHGDREFATGTHRDFLNRVIEENHKMGMNISVVLYLNNDATQIWAKIKFVAEELGGDGTKTDGTWDTKVYEALQGRKIASFLSAPFAYHHFENNINENTFKINYKYTCDIINYYTIIGDTLGDDVSDDDNCNDDTRIENIKFNPVYVIFKN